MWIFLILNTVFIAMCACCPSMLGEFSEEMDQTGSRMDSVLKKMEKVSHMTSSECFYSFIVCSSTSRVFISFTANVCNFSLK